MMRSITWALGHIHKPQWVRSGKIRYSGSLMKYSFSETLQKKSLTLLDWKEKDNLTVTAIPLCPETDMRIIRGKLEDLLTYAQLSADWIRAELTDETLVPYAMERLHAVYPNVLELEFLSQSERIAAGTTEAEAVPEKSLLELVDSFCSSVYQYELSEHETAQALMQSICKEAEQTE